MMRDTTAAERRETGASEPAAVSGKVRAFLAEDFAAIDPELPPLLDALNRRRLAECWHRHGSLRDHLAGVYRILSLWEQPREVRLLGLLHCVYANEYVNLAPCDAKDGRGDLAALVGAEVEASIHAFCRIPRSRFAATLLERDRIPDSGLVLEDDDGRRFPLDRRRIGIFLAVTLADLAEQWFAWQDRIMAGYPNAAPDRPTNMHWPAVLWPGAMRPSMANWSLMSRLARHMPALDLPVPPVFENCSATLSPESEAGAAALYWQVAGGLCAEKPPDAVRRLLESAIERNPFVGEPRLALAQLMLMEGDYAAAETQALEGLELLCRWGTPWDKRIPWSGWVAWARVLLRNARAETWPWTIGLHNNLGIVG